MFRYDAPADVLVSTTIIYNMYIHTSAYAISYVKAVSRVTAAAAAALAV